MSTNVKSRVANTHASLFPRVFVLMECDDKSRVAINTRNVGHHLLQRLLANGRLPVPHGAIRGRLSPGLLEEAGLEGMKLHQIQLV